MKKGVVSKTDNNSFGVASVILGIFSVLFAYPPLYGLILGVTALVFAKKQRNRAANSWSKAGKILSIIGIILSVLLFIALLWITQNPELMGQLGGYGNVPY